MAHDGYIEMSVEALDHAAGVKVVTFGSQALKTSGKPEISEGLRFDLRPLLVVMRRGVPQVHIQPEKTTEATPLI